MKIFASGGHDLDPEVGMVGKWFEVDEEDYESVSGMKWKLLRESAITQEVRRVNARGKKEARFLHRTIALFKFGSLEPTQVVEFIDGNKFNCRKENLRLGERGGKGRCDWEKIQEVMRRVNGEGK